MCVCGTHGWPAYGVCSECDGQLDCGFFFSQESWRGGGTAWRARSSRPLQFAPPVSPIHQMSDELVYNETKSLLVRHDSQGGVPIMHLFTYFFRCMLKHLLICLKHFKKKIYFHVTECEH